MKLQSIDPSNGELIESFDEISDAELETALARAHPRVREHQIRVHYRACRGRRQ